MTLIWLIPVLTYLCFVQGLALIKETSCTTPNGKSGVCKSVLNCESIVAMVNKPGKTPEEVNFLRRSACVFDGDTPKVCCPIQAVPKSCFTPEGNAGQCINILDCEHIAKRLQSPTVSQEDRAYVHSRRCEGPGFRVCCGPPPEQTIVPTGMCTPSAAPPDPRTECCGLDGASNNKLLGGWYGYDTKTDKYPWLALIEYKKEHKIKLLCGGVLISGRYVLTASHCVVGAVLDYGTPTNVRLGEYNTNNPGPDCVAIEGVEGDVDCNADPIIIPIERVIPHPRYNPRSVLRRDDIAMLRLSALAPYTYFVRPICLPTTDITVNFPATEKLYAGGWGRFGNSISNSDIKLYEDLSYKSIEVCQLEYSAMNRRIKLWSGQICAGGDNWQYSCKGDSGGPLMAFNNTIMEVVGILSFGPTPCGGGIPVVYTKVFEYMTWIRGNIQP